MTHILHIIPIGQWEAAQAAGTYRGDTLDAEGFIHFSTAAQVVRVADARFRGHPGLALLVVETDRLAAPLRYEAPFEGAMADAGLFPHLYGPLNLDAVVAVVDFPPGPDGTFTLPELP
jgi:uncharacterized protein (DUF952 family)